jgi:hypothetical protein
MNSVMRTAPPRADRPRNTRVQDILLLAKGHLGFRDPIRDVAVIIGEHALMDADGLRPCDLAAVLLSDTLHLVLGASPVAGAREFLLQLGRQAPATPSRRLPDYYTCLVHQLLEHLAVVPVVDAHGQPILHLPSPDPYIQARLEACERRAQVSHVG